MICEKSWKEMPFKNPGTIVVVSDPINRSLITFRSRKLRTDVLPNHPRAVRKVSETN
jgi:hypothetical protein